MSHSGVLELLLKLEGLLYCRYEDHLGFRTCLDRKPSYPEITMCNNCLIKELIETFRYENNLTKGV